jgi:hypothetical protein
VNGWKAQRRTPRLPVEFDAELNEFHIVRGPKDFLMIYYCPFCGGSAPKSRRARLFHTLTDAERQRLVSLTKDMRTVEDVGQAFGEPDIRQPVGMVITNPERDGKPETTQSYPVLIYTKLSDVADVHVTVYPTDRVGISFQGKAKKPGPSRRCSERLHRRDLRGINMNALNALWITVAAYFVAQCYTLIAWRSAWRLAATVPLVGMVPVIVLTFQAYRQQSNLWPILLLFAAPLVLSYLIVLMILRVTRKKSHG